MRLLLECITTPGVNDMRLPPKCITRTSVSLLCGPDVVYARAEIKVVRCGT